MDQGFEHVLRGLTLAQGQFPMIVVCAEGDVFLILIRISGAECMYIS